MTDRKAPDGKPILTNPDAESADPALPAFLARPKGAPVYHGFPLVEETRTDGWCYGAITAFQDPVGCDAGDGFVVAPDSSRAGLVWSVGTFPAQVICEPDAERWGVYSIAFPRAIRTVEDLVDCFRAVLPELKAIYAEIQGHTAERGEREGNAEA
jgi:hypothetical protein